MEIKRKIEKKLKKLTALHLKRTSLFFNGVQYWLTFVLIAQSEIFQLRLSVFMNSTAQFQQLFVAFQMEIFVDCADVRDCEIIF